MRIGIVGELIENGLSHKTVESISKVKNLHIEIDLILLETGSKELGDLPCDSVVVYNKITGDSYIEKYVKAIEHYHSHYEPSLIILGNNTDVDGIIPKVMARINAANYNHRPLRDKPPVQIAAFLQCDAITYDEINHKFIVIKPVYGGNAMAHYSINKSAILSLKTNQKSKVKLESNKPDVTYIDFKCSCNNKHISKGEIDYIDEKGLSESKFVVVCGKGVGSKKAVAEIAQWAESAGAAVGGTKKVIDHGWLPVHQLIGQTGHTISPKICLVIGASGATPFINGIIGADKIIAINNDKDARIFDYADIGIIDECNGITTELMAHINRLVRE